MTTREFEVYSRQQLILGQYGLQALLKSSLCVYGLDGLGAELAKNALLAGVHNIILCDSSHVSALDISTNICLRAKPLEAYKGTRAQECATVLQSFNPSASISVTEELKLEENKPDLVIVCNQTWSKAQEIARNCREKSVPVIIAFTGGLYYVYALDLGAHRYLDVHDNKQMDFPLVSVELLSTPSSEQPQQIEPPEVHKAASTSPSTSDLASTTEQETQHESTAPTSGIVAAVSNNPNPANAPNPVPENATTPTDHANLVPTNSALDRIEGRSAQDDTQQVLVSNGSPPDQDLNENSTLNVSATESNAISASEGIPTNPSMISSQESLSEEIQQQGSGLLSTCTITTTQQISQTPLAQEEPSKLGVDLNRGNSPSEAPRKELDALDNFSARETSTTQQETVFPNKEMLSPITDSSQQEATAPEEMASSDINSNSLHEIPTETNQKPTTERETVIVEIQSTPNSIQDFPPMNTVPSDAGLDMPSQLQQADPNQEAVLSHNTATPLVNSITAQEDILPCVSVTSEAPVQAIEEGIETPISEQIYSTTVEHIQVQVPAAESHEPSVQEQPAAQQLQELAPSAHKSHVEVTNQTERLYRSSILPDAIFTLSEGDKVEVLEKNGIRIGYATITNVQTSEFYFELSSRIRLAAGQFIQHVPSENLIQFVPLSDLKDDIDGISWPLVLGLKALEKFRACHPEHKSPTPRDKRDIATFLSYVEGLTSDNMEFYQQFCNVSACSTVPVISIVGGLLAEEAVKVLSRSFLPTLYINGGFLDTLYQENLSPSDCFVDFTKTFDILYASQILNFGRIFQQKLAAKSILVVGAGALGNELVKGIAMVGACTLESSLIVVDNDLIMTSNISRQLCFSEADTHKMKVDVLSHKVKELFNPHTRIEPVLLKLDHTSEDVIGHAKFSKVDAYVTALDNVSARNTVERISHMYGKPMIDGGTGGFEGTQENFIPHVTNEYFNPDQTQRIVNCTPKSVVISKVDVIHNAKLHYEKLLDKLEVASENPMQFLLNDIKAVWENAPAEVKNEDGSLKGGKIPILAEPTDVQYTELATLLNSFQSEDKSTFQKYFDKDEPIHVRLLDLICQLVASTHSVPPPSIMEIRHKAGNIIPNIISTTAIISGFMLLNLLQLANSSLKFVNVTYGQAWKGCVQRYQAEPPSLERKSIHYFRNLEPLTIFKDLIVSVPTPYSQIEEITIYGNSKAVISGKAFERLSNTRALRYLMRHAVLGGRRHVVMEIVFRKLEKLGSQIQVLRCTKFLIVTLPNEEVLASIRASVALEIELLELCGGAQTEKVSSLLDTLQRGHEAEVVELMIMSTQERNRWEVARVQYEEKVASQVQENERLREILRSARKELEVSKENNIKIKQAYNILKAKLSVVLSQVDIHLQREVHHEKQLREWEKKERETQSFIASWIQGAQKFLTQAFNGTLPVPPPEPLQPRPLSLPNQGNTCFLASCVQLLYTAQVHAKSSLFSTKTSIGSALSRLFASRTVIDWTNFVNLFYGYFHQEFSRGYQDDSAKAFEAIVGKDWIEPDVTDNLHMIVKVHSEIPNGSCNMDGKMNRIVDHYIVYAGSDEYNANISQELLMQENYERDCDNRCGRVQEKVDFIFLPKILFMVATVGRSFLHAARSFRFPSLDTSRETAQYNLIGASLHSGSNTSGHYTALVKHGPGWWSCSDDTLRTADLEDFISQNRLDIQLLVFEKQE